MINPNQLSATRKRENSPLFAGRKYYLAVLIGSGYAKDCRRIFSRASEAETYSERARQRWIRLYQAAVNSAVEPRPADQVPQ